MKSVIAQASTLAKAISEAWEKAGRPVEFFTKVLQEASSGFLGFGAKKAKVALFFKQMHKNKHEKSLDILKQKEYESLFNNKKLKVSESQSPVQVQKKPSVQHAKKNVHSSTKKQNFQKQKPQQKPIEKKVSNQPVKTVKKQVAQQPAHKQHVKKDNVTKDAIKQQPLNKANNKNVVHKTQQPKKYVESSFNKKDTNSTVRKNQKSDFVKKKQGQESENVQKQSKSNAELKKRGNVSKPMRIRSISADKSEVVQSIGSNVQSVEKDNDQAQKNKRRNFRRRRPVSKKPKTEN